MSLAVAQDHYKHSSASSVLHCVLVTLTIVHTWPEKRQGQIWYNWYDTSPEKGFLGLLALKRAVGSLIVFAVVSGLWLWLDIPSTLLFCLFLAAALDLLESNNLCMFDVGPSWHSLLIGYVNSAAPGLWLWLGSPSPLLFCLLAATGLDLLESNNLCLFDVGPSWHSLLICYVNSAAPGLWLWLGLPSTLLFCLLAATGLDLLESNNPVCLIWVLLDNLLSFAVYVNSTASGDITSCLYK